MTGRVRINAHGLTKDVPLPGGERVVVTLPRTVVARIRTMQERKRAARERAGKGTRTP